MIAWVANGLDTYLVHFDSGRGATFWGAGGADFSELFAIFIGLTAFWHHFNCQAAGCPWPVQHHQTHCKKHRMFPAGQMLDPLASQSSRAK